MSKPMASWSETKLDRWRSELPEFWAQDTWDMFASPEEALRLSIWKRESCRYLTFECASESVKTEIKYACYQKIRRGEWAFGSALYTHLRPFLQWVKETIPSSTNSLLERALSEWKISFLTYRAERGLMNERWSEQLLSTQVSKRYRSPYPAIGRLTQIYRLLEETYDERPEYEKDVWDLRKLGKAANGAHSRYTLNFSVIHQPWLRQLAKMFLKYRITSFSEGNCRHMLWAFSLFSDFLEKEHPHLQASEVNRALALEYYAFLTRKRLTAGSRKRAILNLRIILDVSTREGWAPFPREAIIFEDDLPLEAQRTPRYIPDDVLDQLFNHLGELDEQMQAMVLILYEVGMRVSEMLTLPLDCLLQDTAGGWWIRYDQGKVRTEHTQPISRETAALVQRQQQKARDVLGPDAQILFPGPNGKNIKYHAFARAINYLAVRKEIRDSTGHIWRFQPHQFRHTFGTRLINRGIPQHVVQRLMGHKSPAMTSHYAHVHDATLKREFEKTLQDRKLVDISGRVITANQEADKSELQWLRKYVDARTLPNGLCAIPLALGPCPHPNACLTCPHFRTDQSFLLVHERQLRETEDAVNKAQANGWVVQEKNNSQIAENLRSIISALKADDHDAQA